MTSVSPQVDRLIAVLRQRLQERDRLSAKRAPSVALSGGTDSVAAAHALAAIDDVDERHLRRALIQGFLKDQFGSDALNQAAFQQLVDRVLSAIETDEGGQALLTRLSRDLRAQAR